ncbi:MAG: hypothetical protein OXC48_02030 [Endozoicomonadaceae bacterium]|nr:hypothetical protein [Endozoicomonadaceae bacterium]
MKQLFFFLLTIIFYITDCAYAHTINSNYGTKGHIFFSSLRYVFSIQRNGNTDNNEKAMKTCHDALSDLSLKLYLKITYDNTDPKFILIKDNGFSLSAILYPAGLMHNKTSYAASYGLSSAKFNNYRATNISVSLAQTETIMPIIQILFSSTNSEQRCILSNTRHPC